MPGTISRALAGATPAAWTLPPQVHGAQSFSAALLTSALSSGSLTRAVPTAQPAPAPRRGWLSVWVTSLSRVSGACLVHEAAQCSLVERLMRALSCSGPAWPRPSGLFCSFSCLQKSGNGIVGPKQLPAEGPISGLGPRHTVAWGMVSVENVTPHGFVAGPWPALRLLWLCPCCTTAPFARGQPCPRAPVEPSEGGGGGLVCLFVAPGPLPSVSLGPACPGWAVAPPGSHL